MQITILGCGPSIGIPDITDNWGNCNPQNPKNRRTRSALFIEHKRDRFLIDAGPDIKSQFALINPKEIDALLITHTHFDHIGGIGELRRITQTQNKKISVYMNELTAQEVMLRDKFFFNSDHPFYPPIFTSHIVSPFEAFNLHQTSILPFQQVHGSISSLGFRIGNFAYSTDFKSLPPESLECLKGLDLWIVECISEIENPSHSCLQETLELIHYLKPKHAILTHMGNKLDYDNLKSKLPSFVEPAFDGMVLQL